MYLFFFLVSSYLVLYSAVLRLFFIFLYSLLSGAREKFPTIIVLSLVTIFIGRGSSGYEKLL